MLIYRYWFVVARTAGLALVILLANVVEGGADSVPSGRRVALSGYDPVAYFTLGHPEKGNAAYSMAFDDAIYHFMSADHLAKFAADPERYAPQYDGYCAAGVARGVKHEPDPEAWAIINGRLYVVELKSRLAKFKEESEKFIGNADTNWRILRADPSAH